MFREMRRSNQQLTMEETQNILQKGTSGVLSLLGDESYPYGVPLSYVYDGEKLYFHCAKTGHKIDAVHRESKASFCVIDQDLIMPQKYTTYFRSAIAFGKVRILESEQEKREAIEKLAVKYAPEDLPSHREDIIAQEWAPLCVLEMEIHHLTGKQAKELAASQE